MKGKRKIKLKTGHNKPWDSSFLTIPGWDAERIREARVMVVGAGALGNEVVKNLTLLNVGHILIVDFDIVEYNNLAKSVLFTKEDTGSKKALALARNLKKINDSVKTHTIVGDISTDVGLGLFRRVDVVIGCLDNRLARLFINRHCWKTGKTWIDGGLENLSGKFTVYSPGKSCYECGLSDEAWELVRYRLGCPDIAKRNASAGVIATTPVSSSIIGAFQVQEALKVIFNDWDNSMAGEGFQYDGVNNFFLKYRESELKEDCDSHTYYHPLIEAEGLSHTMRIREVLDWLQSYFETKELKILLDEDVVLEAAVASSGKATELAIYKNHLLETREVARLECGPEEEVVILDSTSYLDHEFPYPEKTLEQIGIPFLDILRVEANQDIHFVELSGDAPRFSFD